MPLAQYTEPVESPLCGQCLNEPDFDAVEEGWRKTNSEGRELWFCPPCWERFGL